MKKFFKSALALSLSLIMLMGAVAIGGNGISDVLMLKTSAYSTGDYIYYGTYPQTDVTAELGDTLNELPGTWVSYGYYVGTSYDSKETNPSDFMRYKDVVYNGVKYRAVTFDEYKPVYTSFPYQEPSMMEARVEIPYFRNNVYWFKYEPIKWKVLDPETGFVMCATAIDTQPFQNDYYRDESVKEEYSYFVDESHTTFANNYSVSNVRQWLNGDFYNTAFTVEEKANIEISTLNNACYNTLKGKKGYEVFDGEPTNDKVFLLSNDEVRNTQYGFKAKEDTGDPARIIFPTDYAVIQGCEYYWTYENEKLNIGGSNWLLRTPNNNSSATGFVYYDGPVLPGDASITQYGYSVVPAMKLGDLRTNINVSDGNGNHTSYDDEGNVISTGECTFDSDITPADCTNDGVKIDTCITCGFAKTEILAAGHKEASANNSIVPTCTLPGKESDTVCSECGITVHEGAEIPAGHVFGTSVLVAPKCESEGYDSYTCSECGYVYGDNFTPAKGHTQVSANNAVKATCEKAGKESDKICAECGAILYAGKVISATGHTDKDGNGVCDSCKKTVNSVTAEKKLLDSVRIYVPKSATLAWKTHVAFKVAAKGVPKGYSMMVYLGKNTWEAKPDKDGNCNFETDIGNIKTTGRVSVRIVKDGVPKANSSGPLEKDFVMTVKSGFMDKLSATFRYVINFFRRPYVLLKY